MKLCSFQLFFPFWCTCLTHPRGPVQERLLHFNWNVRKLGGGVCVSTSLPAPTPCLSRQCKEASLNARHSWWHNHRYHLLWGEGNAFWWGKKEWVKLLARTDLSWVLKGRHNLDRELWGAWVTQQWKDLGKVAKGGKRWKCTGSYELSSVGRKMLGRLHTKLGKMLTALDGRWRCSDLILYIVQNPVTQIRTLTCIFLCARCIE